MFFLNTNPSTDYYGASHKWMDGKDFYTYAASKSQVIWAVWAVVQVFHSIQMVHRDFQFMDKDTGIP